MTGVFKMYIKYYENNSNKIKILRCGYKRCFQKKLPGVVILVIIPLFKYE